MLNLFIAIVVNSMQDAAAEDEKAVERHRHVDDLAREVKALRAEIAALRGELAKPGR